MPTWPHVHAILSNVLPYGGDEKALEEQKKPYFRAVEGRFSSAPLTSLRHVQNNI